MKKTELVLKIITSLFFILAIILGILAVVRTPRDTWMFFIAMVCALFGNIFNLIRILIKRKK